MQGAGQTLEGFKPVLKSGTLTLKSNCYARITVKGALTDVKIEVPSGLRIRLFVQQKTLWNYSPKLRLLMNF